MRLIGEFPTERAAFAFHAFLLKEGIKNVYELSSEVSAQKRRFRVWIIDEDDLERAFQYYQEYLNSPDDPRFCLIRPLAPTEEVVDEDLPKEGEIIAAKNMEVTRRKKPSLLTLLIIGLCIFVFFLNEAQEVELVEKYGEVAVQVELTPLQKNLLFDIQNKTLDLAAFVERNGIKNLEDLHQYPLNVQQEFEAIQKSPEWDGVVGLLEHAKTLPSDYFQKITLFTKIRQGEIWRLITPIFLHAGLLHIVFNLLWIWILCRQVEERIKPLRLLLLITCIALVSNVAQYVMSGPYFLGISGVVVGLAGFIWKRQKIAPWEGYRLSRATVLFLLIYVLSMVGLELVTLMVSVFSSHQISESIANTAHLVGGFLGYLFAKFPFFSRRAQ